MWTYSYAIMKHDNETKKIKFDTDNTWDAYGTAANTQTPRDIDSGTHKPKIEEGTGPDYEFLADEKYFTKYCHLLPSDKCDPCNIMEQVYNHTQDTSIGIHANTLKAAPGDQPNEGFRGKAGTLHIAASQLESAVTSGVADSDSPKKEAKELKEAVGPTDTAGAGNPTTLRQALNQLGDATIAYSPKTKHTQTDKGFPGWTKSFEYTAFGGEEKTADAYFWHLLVILIVNKISLPIIFIYSLHYTLNTKF